MKTKAQKKPDLRKFKALRTTLDELISDLLYIGMLGMFNPEFLDDLIRLGRLRERVNMYIQKNERRAK